MKLYRTRSFEKQYRKLSGDQALAVDKAIQLFVKNPTAPKLENHALQGKMNGKRAIKAGYDLRIIFVEENGYAIAIMIGVGTHQQVYGK